MAPAATVFIVDDDDAVRESLKLLLETAGFAVVAFSTGTAFLEALPTAAQGCALMDVRMPGMGGFEVLQELRRRNRIFPVIVITGHGDVPLAVRAMKEGASDFIEKPFSDDAILGSIERALALGRESQEEQSAIAEILVRANRLTSREREVMIELVAGHPNKVIAYHLDISARTVEIHRARVMEKMQARNLSELVRMAVKAGLLPRTAE